MFLLNTSVGKGLGENRSLLSSIEVCCPFSTNTKLVK